MTTQTAPIHPPHIRALNRFYGFLEGWMEPYAVQVEPYRETWGHRNAANCMTVARLAASLIISYCLYQEDVYAAILGLLFLQGVCMLLDGVDGTWARITKTTSKSGRVLDGLADRLTFAAMLLALCLHVNRLDSWPSSSAKGFVAGSAILWVGCEIWIGIINGKRLKRLGKDFIVLPWAKWRFLTQGMAMIFPWLAYDEARQANFFVMAALVSAVSSLTLLTYMRNTDD